MPGKYLAGDDLYHYRQPAQMPQIEGHKKKISSYLYKTNPHANAVEIRNMLVNLPLYNDLNNFCNTYLSRSLAVTPVSELPSTYAFTLTNKDGHEYFLDDLSA